MARLYVLFAVLLLLPQYVSAQEPDASLPGHAEIQLLRQLEQLEAAWTEPNDSPVNARWILRSRHFVFGMPRVIDDRHDFTPDGFDSMQPGISVIVREAFVVAHFDRMKAPRWVAQRWTRFDHIRMSELPSQGRPWREDLELLAYARGGTSYQGNQTHLDRGHMARHAMNRAWGVDASNWGTKMSNSAPQHRRINRLGSAWAVLEDEVRDIVVRPDAGIEAVWTISGTIFRDRENPGTEAPEDDFQIVVRLAQGGFGIPNATYKVVAWFDRDGRFQARGYIFEQPNQLVEQGDGEFDVAYTLGNPQAPLTEFLVRIDDIEERTGLDFFPMLRNDVENNTEGAEPDTIW